MFSTMSNFLKTLRANGEEVLPSKQSAPSKPNAARDELRVPLTLSANKYRHLKKQSIHDTEARARA